MKAYYIFLAALFLCGCTDSLLPELRDNPFSGEGLVRFPDLQATSSPTSQTRADVTITFRSVYSELNSVQQSKITGIEVNGGTGIQVQTLAADASRIDLMQLRIGQPYVVSLHFITETGTMPGEEIRFVP